MSMPMSSTGGGGVTRGGAGFFARPPCATAGEAASFALLAAGFDLALCFELLAGLFGAAFFGAALLAAAAGGSEACSGVHAAARAAATTKTRGREAGMGRDSTRQRAR